MGDTGESCRISPPCLVPHGFHCFMVWTKIQDGLLIATGYLDEEDTLLCWRSVAVYTATRILHFCSKLNLLLSISNLYLPQTVLFVPLNSSKIHPAQTSLTVAVNWTSPLLSLSLPLSVSIGNINSEVSLCISHRFTSSQHQGLQ